MGGGGSKPNKKAVDMSHFEVHKCLGKGGFGKVNAVEKCSQPNKGKWFAIKALEKKRLVDSGHGHTEALNELSFVKDLNHPQIANGHFAFQDDSYLYLVLDCAMKSDLRVNMGLQKKANKKFTEEEVKYFVASMLLALDYCHSRGVLHRDIKPDNMLLEERGSLKLTDFGISQRVDDIKDPLTCKAMSGTPAYIAPEVKARQGHGVASEMFSLGVVTQELCLLINPSPAPKCVMPDAPTAGVSENMISFVKMCFGEDKMERMGSKGGMQDGKDHALFAGYKFESVVDGSLRPPFVRMDSKVVVQGNAGLVDVSDSLFAVEPPKIPADKQHLFADYMWNTELNGASPKASPRAK